MTSVRWWLRAIVLGFVVGHVVGHGLRAIYLSGVAEGIARGARIVITK